jgi:hypothetical protein
VKYFNTAGPCESRWHYMVPPEPRLPQARGLIQNGLYFVVHAPRQTGKTTTLQALARDLTAAGRYAAVLFSCERAKVAVDDYGAAGREVLDAIRAAAEDQLPEECWPPPWPVAQPGGLLHVGLTRWARTCPRPLALFADEIDALRGQSLISVLSQLRDGYRTRPESFPAAVVLCGLRDVRDYRAAAGSRPWPEEVAVRMGTSSPFNVKVESLRLPDFTAGQVADLYGQHTAETGQEFTPEAVDLTVEYTCGQPWLVNALAREITDKMQITPPTVVTADHVAVAKERLILARATHLDSLAARLAEPRVRRIMEPLIAGLLPDLDTTYNDDAAYVRDLGLIALGDPVRVANPIYREVIVRVLGAGVESVVTAEPRAFVLADGRLDFRRVLDEFAAFWAEHSDVLTRGQVYHEAAPQLVFMAFLQRIVNGGGQVEREYGVGRGRIDVLVRKPYRDRQVQREAVELKVWRPRQADPLEIGLKQLDGYLTRLGLDHGTLVIFDRRQPRSDEDEPIRPEMTDVTSPEGRAVTLLRA